MSTETTRSDRRIDTTITELVPQAQCRDCDLLPEAGYWTDVERLARAHVLATGHTVVVTSATAVVYRPAPAPVSIRR